MLIVCARSGIRRPLCRVDSPFPHRRRKCLLSPALIPGAASWAFEQLILRVRQSKGGQGLAREDIRSLVKRVVDTVIQFGVDGPERYIEEISLTNPGQDL